MIITKMSIISIRTIVDVICIVVADFAAVTFCNIATMIVIVIVIVIAFVGMVCIVIIVII